MTKTSDNIRIRVGVFETNSSSSHSLTTGDAELTQTFHEHDLRAGKIPIILGEYGWEWKRFRRPENKASYLLTSILNNSEIKSKEDVRDEVCKMNEDARNVIEAIEEHTGCRVEIYTGGFFYIDHESVNLYRQIGRDKESILSFILSPSAFVTTGNDNSYPPDQIMNDMGRPEPYLINTPTATARMGM
jgi:hypothetical protein